MRWAAEGYAAEAADMAGPRTAAGKAEARGPSS